MQLWQVRKSWLLFSSFMTVQYAPYFEITYQSWEKKPVDQKFSKQSFIWPIDLFEFEFYTGINKSVAISKSCFEMSSDHFPIKIDLTANQISSYNNHQIYKKTNWIILNLEHLWIVSSIISTTSRPLMH